jgi:FkbM family methyltransferase
MSTRVKSRLRLLTAVVRIAITLGIAQSAPLQALKRLVLKHIIVILTSQPVPVHGFEMFLNPQDQTSPLLYLSDRYEPLASEIVGRIDMAGSCVLDIGANIGYYTLILSQKVGNTGSVFSFEPEESNFSVLKRNLRLNHTTNVTVFRLALNNESGTAYLGLSDSNMGDHRLLTQSSLSRGQEKRVRQMVEMTRLDDVLPDQESNRIRFIKMDVQGSEYHVLKGAERFLSNQAKNLVILIEYDPELLRETSTDPVDLIALISRLGFRVFKLDDNANRIVEIPDPIVRVPQMSDVNLLLVGSERDDVLRELKRGSGLIA